MITCPSCNHQNPEGSLQCENCYTPLPATTSCPNCGASVQTDATFCGQCGFNLQAESSSPVLEETAIAPPLPNISLDEMSSVDKTPVSKANSDILPETAVVSPPIQSPWDDDDDIEPTQPQMQQLPDDFPELESTEVIEFSTLPETELVEVESSPTEELTMPEKSESPFDLELEEATTEATTEATDFSDSLVIQSPEVEVEEGKLEESESIAADRISIEEEVTSNKEVPTRETMTGATQLQVQTASLLHLQSNTSVEIPLETNIVHIGKPNAQIPPDVDVAGFSNSEVVSRIHADIRIEGDAYYIEDVGSSNGTYINHAPLPEGNRHRLRTGDRIALGKGDLVTFVFQLDSTIQS